MPPQAKKQRKEDLFIEGPTSPPHRRKPDSSPPFASPGSAAVGAFAARYPAAASGTPTDPYHASTLDGKTSMSPMDEDDSSSAASPASQAPHLTPSQNGTNLVHTARSPSKDPKLQPERTGRACLACRRLKTRCDGAEDPPCRRCRQGGHECIFVESKRGKRPAKKPPANDAVAEKLKTVEQTLGSVLQAMSQGQTPDMQTLQHLQELSASGVQALTASPTASSTASGTPMNAYGVLPSPRQPQRSMTAGTMSATTSPAMHSTPQLSSQPMLSTNGGSAAQPARSSPGAALNLLAEASLAAELDGRKTLTGLDSHFRLHSLTGALAFSSANVGGIGAPPGAAETMGSNEPPALLTKRIVDPTTAVELFRLFFDFCYLHLPILDPTTNTATAVCARSPFLFSAICAVGARFQPDRELERKCYEEAHTCFITMIARGERSIDGIHACLILTVWAHAPQQSEDRIRLAWLYFSTAVRLGLELNIFRPPSFSNKVKLRGGVAIGSDPWGAALQDVPEDVQRDALNRERTWMLCFIVDRYISAALGRPPTIHDCKPFLLPSHPLSLPFDLGIIAHLELQSIVGQVMETFHDRIFGHASANDDMPSPVVIKLFNARLDEWKSRWARSQGDPVSANLLFYYYNSVLYLNSIPLQSMLRSNNTVADPDCVSKTVTSARAVLDLCHEFSDLGVLRHCPDLTFLYMLFANVFLIKLKLSQTSFNAVMKTDELIDLTRRAITDCQSVNTSPPSAAGISALILTAIYNSFGSDTSLTSSAPSRVPSNASSAPPTGRGLLASESLGLVNMAGSSNNNNNNSSSGPNSTVMANADSIPMPVTSAAGTTDVTLAPAATRTPSVMQDGPHLHPYFGSTLRPLGTLGSGANTPSAFASGNVPNDIDSGFFDSLLTDSLLVSQGEAGFLPNMFSLLNSSASQDHSMLPVPSTDSA